MYVLMAVIFVLGYLCIALEHSLKVDKAASAILTAVLCWTALVLGATGGIGGEGDTTNPGVTGGQAAGGTDRHQLFAEQLQAFGAGT